MPKKHFNKMNICIFASELASLIGLNNFKPPSETLYRIWQKNFTSDFERIYKIINNRDIILENLEREYIKKESVNEDGSPKDVFMGMYTFQECKEREINLGLDLKGGMNVTLEVSVKDVLVSLSGKNKDVKFTLR